MVLNMTLLTTRRILAALSLVAAASAKAQPTGRVVRTVVGFAAGGPQDIVARLYAEQLRGRYAPQVIVENRTGAGGRLGVEAVKAAPPDGTTLLIGAASLLTIYPHLYGRALRYDALTDLTPVTPVCVYPFALAVRSDHPARDLETFAVWSRSRGETPFASPAAGSMPHFLGVQIGRSLGLSLTHVPYRGTAPAVQDLLGGQIPAVLVPVGGVSTYQRSGALRILGLSSEERLDALPGVPTFAEQGHGDLTAEEWLGALLPAGVPEALVEELRRSFVTASDAPEVRDGLARLDYRPLTSSSAEFVRRLRAERDQWGPIVQASGFRPDD
jgi:tripartite-type tricarboxylate transporter receptor subunit TctC